MGWLVSNWILTSCCCTDQTLHWGPVQTYTTQTPYRHTHTHHTRWNRQTYLMQFAQLLAAFEVLQDRCEEVLGQYVLHEVPQGLTPEVWRFRHFGCQELHCLSHLQNRHSISIATSFLGCQCQETCWPRTAFLWQRPFCAAKVRKPAGQRQHFYGYVLSVQPRSGNQLAKNIILMAIPFLCSQSHEAGRSRTTFLW